MLGLFVIGLSTFTSSCCHRVIIESSAIIMSEAIVLYPSPAIGHLISMVELGKLIVALNPFLSVHVLVAGTSYNSGAVDSYMAAVSSVTFHRLPAVSLPPDTAKASPHHELLALETLRLNNPNVRRALVAISEKFSVKAFVMDFFCIDALPVAAELGVPPFYFFTSAAGCLALTLRIPIIHKVISEMGREGFQNLVFDVPGIPPVKHSDLPEPFRDPADPTAHLFKYCSAMMVGSAGIIVNTFESLELRTLRSISEGLCVPDKPTPPVYAVGPLITSSGGGGSAECMTWLDAQPRGSVVFLCFGSLGVFSKEQLSEIAIGLERSGRRFLWVVRNPPPRRGQSVDISADSEPDLDALLPDGWLSRTKARGFVVKKWAPQVDVLSHDSVGGFVSHVGWNSVLESVCAGVPMVAWPLYAEQRLNRVLLVEEMRIAFPMEAAEGGFVSAAEVEKRVGQLMDSAEGESARERVMVMKREAEAAFKDGGSSRVALTKFVDFIK